MASICHRCALRLQRAAKADTRHVAQRAFSVTAPSQKSLVSFPECSNKQLGSIIDRLQEYHFTPAALLPSDRKLIYAAKNKQLLVDYERKVTLGDTDVTLRYIDRRREPENRTKLLGHAIKIICANGDHKDWAILPGLLQSFNQIIKKPVDERKLRRIIYGAADANRIPIIIQCLQQAERTGMSLKSDAVLDALIEGIYSRGEKSNWSKNMTESALKNANELATLMESEEHGSGRNLQPNDPRSRPGILAMYLDLAAINAAKHQDGNDEAGLVKSYAQRLLSRLSEHQVEPSETKIVESGKQTEMIDGIWTWHGVHLARKILGQGMPHPDLAAKLDKEYPQVLNKLAKELEARKPDPLSYAGQAIARWKRCSED